MTTYLQNISFIKFSKLFNWDAKQYINTSSFFNKDIEVVLFKEFAKKAEIESIQIKDELEYKILGVRSYGFGAFVNRKVKGKTLKMKVYQKAKSNHLFWCKVDTKNGAFGIITDELEDGIASSNMTFAELNTNKINPEYLQILFRSKAFNAYMDSFVTGTTNRKYVRPNQIFEEIKLPLPPLNNEDALKQNLPNTITQKKLVIAYNQKLNDAEEAKQKAKNKEAEIETYLLNELGINKTKNTATIGGLSFVKFKDLDVWGFDKVDTKGILQSNKYPNLQLSQIAEINPTTSFTKMNSDLSVSFIPMTNISDIDGEVKLYSKGKVTLSKGYTKFKNGDLLWARITPCMENGKSAIVNNMENGFGYGSTEYHIIRTSNSTLTKFLHLLLRYDKILQAARGYFTGSAGQQRVPKSFLEKLNVPFPAPNIQENIIKNITKMKQEIKELYLVSSDLKKQSIEDFEKIIFK